MWKPTSKKTSLHFNVDGDAVGILTTFKLPKRTKTNQKDVNLFRIKYGESWFGIRLGNELHIDFSDEKKLSTTSFSQNLFDDSWHRVGIQIVEKFASFYLDCRLMGTTLLGGTFNVFPDREGSLEFGVDPDDPESGMVGIFEELFIHFSYDAARNYCTRVAITYSHLPKKEQ